MKYVQRIACLAVLLLLTALPVCAADHQNVAWTEDESGGYFNVTSESSYAPIWVTPTLDAGERLLEPGTITLSNTTDTEQTVALDYVELPFDNANALIYLNHLNITVCEGETVLYDGPYSRINDEGGLECEYTLAPQEEVVLTVDLRRDYKPLAVTGFEGDSRISWKFVNIVDVIIDPNPTTKPQVTKPTTVTTTAPAEPEPFGDPELGNVLLAAGAAAVLLVLVCIVQLVRKMKAAPAPAEDAADEAAEETEVPPEEE